MEEAFDLTSKAVKSAVFAPPIVRPMRLHRDNGLHSSGGNGINDSVGIIARISDERSACRVRNEMFRLHRVMLLAGRQRDVERLAFGRRDGVQLG